MNSNPKPPGESDHPGVKVRAYDARSGALIPTTDDEEGGGAVVELRPLEKEEPWEFTLELYVPPSSIGALADVQYVMTTDASESGEAKFTGSASGCDGNRAHGRGANGVSDKKNTGVLPFRIEHDAFAAKLGEDGKEKRREAVDVWAGWATDHAPVQLTERLTFRLKPMEGGTSEGDGKGDGAGPGKDEANGEAKVDVDAEREKIVHGVGGDSNDVLQSEMIAEALNRMKDFERKGAVQHGGGADDVSREKIVRDQMGIPPDAEAMEDAINKQLLGLGRNGDDAKKKKRKAAKGLAETAQEEEWDAEKVREGLDQTAQERKKAMKKKRREEKRGRNGPSTEDRRRKERPRRAVAVDDDYSAAERHRGGGDEGEEGRVSSTVFERFRRRRRYDRDYDYFADGDGGEAGGRFRWRGYGFGAVLIVLFVAGLKRYARTADRRWNKGARIL